MNPHDHGWELAPENAHPSARELLTEAVYWDCSDQFSPLGSDTGADIRVDYSLARSADEGLDPLGFLEDELAEWGVEFNSWMVTDPIEVGRLLEEDAQALAQADEAAIALAFAIFIMDGVVPKAVLEVATAAATREALHLVACERWTDPEHRVFRLKRDIEKLAKMPAV